MRTDRVHREQRHAQTHFYCCYAGVPPTTPTIPEENGDTNPEENGDTNPATVKGNVEGKKQTGWYFCEMFTLKIKKKS